MARLDALERREAPPLPDDIEKWPRAIKAERQLNDMVEDIHRMLVNDSDKYRLYLKATWDQHAVTGSLSFDNCKACELIQEKAKEIGYTEVVEEKLGVINLALGVVLRRYKASRKQRRNTVYGEEVPTGNSDD